MVPNAVFDRGKQPKRDITSSDEMDYLRRLESSIEFIRESLPIDERQSQNANILNFEDTLNDVDLESFDCKSIKLKNSTSEMKLSNNNTNNLIKDNVETASLSNFHNVRDVLLNIHQRLEQYLKTSKDITAESSATVTGVKLENKIEELKQDLEQYVEMINEKKENELRKFSENMSNRNHFVCMKNAFMRKEITSACSTIGVYDTLNLKRNDAVSYYSNDSESDSAKIQRDSNGFTLQNTPYYDRCSLTSSFDTNSVEYYSMLINEERTDNLVNDAPPPTLLPRYQEREKISLIYRTPEHVIKQWQKYQLNTITIKPKKNKSVKINLTKEKKMKPVDIWSFTLDYHKTRVLQMKLEKERKIRFICRLFFYFFGLVCFILIVILVQSVFNTRKK